MKKTTAKQIWLSGALACILAALLYLTGVLPIWIAAAVIVCLSPITIMSLFFWWMAGQTGGDIPFIGY